MSYRRAIDAQVSPDDTLKQLDVVVVREAWEPDIWMLKMKKMLSSAEGRRNPDIPGGEGVSALSSLCKATSCGFLKLDC